MPGELPLTGGCGCGAVRFEVDEPLTAALYCHCTRCQRRTGAAAGATGRVAPGSVRVVSGEEHLRDWFPEGGMGKTFCVLCGSSVMGRTPDGTITGRAPRRAGRGPRHPAGVPAVRGLRGGLGADPGRRHPAPRGVARPQETRRSRPSARNAIPATRPQNDALIDASVMPDALTTNVTTAASRRSSSASADASAPARAPSERQARDRVDEGGRATPRRGPSRGPRTARAR